MRRTASRRAAIVDLGSNSARLIVMHFMPGESYHLEDEIREVVRLRSGLSEAGLAPEAMERALVTLRLFHRFCESLRVETVIPTATSAVREATNGPLFLAQVQESVGWKLRVLDGAEEARYGVLGLLNALPMAEGTVVDIGGGSAQVSQVAGRRFQQGQALTLGALALTERFISSDPPKKRELRALRAEIEQQLDEIPWLGEAGPTLAGLGGTIRNLAKIEAARQEFPLNSINGFWLPRSALDETIRQLSTQPLGLRRKIAGLKSDRADIILAGALVLLALMERLGSEGITISESGLREGLFCEQFWAGESYPIPPDLRHFSVLNLARFYGYQEAHAQHVRHLATSLFDQLASLHGYGAEERELLAAAALLHDLGTVISYNDHHKHSETLIAGNGLRGFSPRETALVALLARYHRKGSPTPSPYEPILAPGDGERLLRLAALLRLAEFLERGRTGLVREVRARHDDETLSLTLVASEFPAVELWDSQRNAIELVESAYGRQVLLETEIGEG